MRVRSLLVLLALAVLTACGGSSGGNEAAPSPSPSVDPAVAEAEVTQTWEAFFKGGGTVDDHIALLENGDAFRAELEAQAKDPNNADLAAKVTKVTVLGTTASVTYDLLGKGGTPLLPGAGGNAVQVDGKWKVSKKTYCQLITLQDPKTTHAGCASS